MNILKPRQKCRIGFSNDLDRGSETLQHLLSINLTISLGITDITTIRLFFD